MIAHSRADRGARRLLARVLALAVLASAPLAAQPVAPTTAPAPPPPQWGGSAAPGSNPSEPTTETAAPAATAPPPVTEPPASVPPAPTAGAAPTPPAAASANVAPTPATAPAPAEPPRKRPAPPAAHGFQAAFRTGIMMPVGDATGQPNDTLAGRYAWQVPIAVDLGMRFAEKFFLGGYLGIGFGSTGSDARLEAACSDDDDDLENDIVCSAVTLRAGLEVQYSFRPDQALNPWVGYGIGFEAATAQLSDENRGYEETVTSSGLTFAQLSVGFDARYGVGIGPFLEVAVGSFNRTTTDSGSSLSTSTSIDRQAVHAWVMVGGRLVINP